MKIINTEELLKLKDTDKIKVIKQIILGEVKFIGGTDAKKWNKEYCL